MKDWDISDTMSVVTHDDKHHLNYNVPTDNLRLTRHIRDNILGMVNHAVTLTGTNLMLWNEYEKHSESDAIALKRLTCKLFIPSSKELSLNYLKISMDSRNWVCDVLVILVLAGAHVFGNVK